MLTSHCFIDFSLIFKGADEEEEGGRTPPLIIDAEEQEKIQRQGSPHPEQYQVFKPIYIIQAPGNTHELTQRMLPRIRTCPMRHCTKRTKICGAK